MRWLKEGENMARNIVVIVGSLRKASINRRAAEALAGLAPHSLSLAVAEIGDLPLYNEDLDGDAPPAAWQRFREEVRAGDGVIFVSPEYNRGVPAPLKNAIDVGSRPYGKAAWTGKPGGVLSLSPGAYGGFGANHQLRQSMVFLDVPMMQQPETYIGGAGKAFGEDGAVTDERVETMLRRFIEAYAAWVERLG
jgi:chromate reductase, NAD(P)H dehydrogenase (quinone)